VAVNVRISSFITITRPEQRGDTYKQCLESAHGFSDEVAIIDGKDTWPQEFDWKIIGEHFQKGYDHATGDWVIHLDTDFIFHEKDYRKIRAELQFYNEYPALSFYKWQFIQPDRYNLKSRLPLAVNKGKFCDRIKFDGGGDLCQPTLDSVGFDLDEIPQSGIEFYNYEKILKTKEQIMEDQGRMERAYKRHFGEYQMSSDDTDQSAYDCWIHMQVGRYTKPLKQIPLSYHPAVMQETIKNLKPEQWGYNGFNNFERNNYV